MNKVIFNMASYLSWLEQSAVNRCVLGSSPSVAAETDMLSVNVYPKAVNGKDSRLDVEEYETSIFY